MNGYDAMRAAYGIVVRETLDNVLRVLDGNPIYENGDTCWTVGATDSSLARLRDFREDLKRWRNVHTPKTPDTAPFDSQPSALAAQSLAPHLFNGYDAEHWHGSYRILSDAVGKHLAAHIVEDDVAEEAIYAEAIESAASALAAAQRETVRVTEELAAAQSDLREYEKESEAIAAIVGQCGEDGDTVAPIKQLADAYNGLLHENAELDNQLAAALADRDAARQDTALLEFLNEHSRGSGIVAGHSVDYDLRLGMQRGSDANGPLSPWPILFPHVREYVAAARTASQETNNG